MTAEATVDLTAAPVPTPPPRRNRLRRLRRVLALVVPPVVVFVAVVGLWYAASHALLSEEKRFLMPPPEAVLRTGFLDHANLVELLQGLRVSARVALTGLLVAVALGMASAVLMSQARWLERALYPYAVVLQTIPILALTPVFGYVLGYGDASRVTVVVLFALFPIVANTLFGLKSVDRAHHELFTLHGAGRYARLVKLQLPAALPAVFTGLRISAGLSVIGAIVSDFFFQQGEPGLGQLILTYPKRLQSEQLFAAVILSSLFGIAVFWLFGAVANRVAAWHESSSSSSELPNR